MNIKSLLLTVAAITILSGCAHPISLSPNIDTITADKSAKPIPKNAGFVLTEATRTTEVTTPGGGGDKVSYHPYRDIEIAFYKMLDNVFDNVTKMKNGADAEVIAKNNVSYVITPTLVTNSSSPSPFTWPPTKFSIELTCSIADMNGKELTTLKVTGEGAAEFDEFKKDFSLSAKRAAEDALRKMQKALLEAPILRN
tara:strand:- start:25870 stop:26460 length:591 start_codon:yes stop_codon:yes gene_type:complete